jgi:putative restriction endonuclease
MSALSSHLASDQLMQQQPYTRDQLRQLFGITEATIETGVFRPSGYNSVWLFVTARAGSSSIPQSKLLDDNTLVWTGQLAGRTDQLIITHELRGLELLVFYRESHVQYPGAGFCYLGRFEYQSHSGSRPALFTLARSGSMPSVAEVQASQDAHAAFNPASIRDGREWVLASIVRRRGQSAFRKSLLDAYSGTCAVTGCRIEPLLEAAHIIPYLGPSTNHTQNGLLLRADIHTLFDLQLLAINPSSLTVELAPELAESEYQELSGCMIALPTAEASRPSRDALRAHRIRCSF